MAIVTFEKLSDHNAVIKEVNRVIWRIRIIGTIDEYYIRADQAHSKLGGGYWAEIKHLIPLTKVTVPEAFVASKDIPRMPTSYANIKCGHCGIINLLNLDDIHKAQGSHWCKQCKSTVCVVTGKQLVLKNGSQIHHITTH